MNNRVDTINPKNFYNFTKQVPILPIRVISYFLRSKYSDPKDDDEYKIRGWNVRAPYVYELLNRVNADILFLQGSNIEQCYDLIKVLEPQGYHIEFRASHTGKESRDVTEDEWTGSFNGIAFFKGKFKLKDKGGFWLKDEPDISPPLIPDTNSNRRPLNENGTNKCFGDTHSYRYVFHMTLINLQSDYEIIIGTSHFPIGGTDARSKSTILTMERLGKIANNNRLIFGGALMFYQDKDGNMAYETLIRYANDYRNSLEHLEHLGHQTSFIGYPNDSYKVPISENGIAEPRNLDIIVQRGFKSIRSFIMSGEINITEKKLILPLISKIKDIDKRLFASDRFLIGADLEFIERSEIENNQELSLNPINIFNFSKNLSPKIIRVVNWNIRTSYLDPKDPEKYLILGWHARRDYVLNMLEILSPDFILLQEMSPSQCKDIKYHLNDIGYNIIFRAAHTGHDLSEIIDGEYTGSISGIAFYRHRFCLSQHGGFWLKSDPYIPPPMIPDNYQNRKSIDDGGINKCFGDSHSYRQCQWATFFDNTSDKLITTAVSDFPNRGKNSRLESAKLCKSILGDISRNNPLIFAGEICTFEDPDMDGIET
jgi:hypothetical protein